MNEKELKLTDLDYAIGDHHIQMLKAALPYMEIAQQRAMSFFIKWNELVRTMAFFEENGDGMMSVCSLDENHVSPVDMLNAVKPYATGEIPGGGPFPWNSFYLFFPRNSSPGLKRSSL